MNTQRAASLLASGLKPAQVATVLGVTPARISQLLSTEEFSTLLQVKEAELKEENEEEVSLSTKYSAVEHLLLNQIMEASVGAELKDVSAALRVVSDRQEKMKARTLGSRAIEQGAPKISAVINLPNHIFQAQNMTFNNKNEVIAVGDRALAPLPSQAVTSLFNSFNPPAKLERKETENVPIATFRSPEKSSLSNLQEEIEEDSFLNYATA